MLYNKTFLALLGLLFSVQKCLAATQIAKNQQQHSIKTVIKMLKKKFFTPSPLPMLTLPKNKNLSRADLTKVQLPQDLSYTNLTGANLAGHHFSHTNFTEAQLRGVILTDTTCDYQQCFQENVHINKLKYGKWYLKNLSKDLKSIAQVYPKLAEDSHKAKLLQIACGLAYLPYYEESKFYFKLQYWSCKMLLIKKQVPHLGKPLVCLLASQLKYEAENYCWKTAYPAYLEDIKGMQIASWWCRLVTHYQLPKALSRLIQHYLTEPPQKLHANFDRYLQLFQEGLVKYNVMSKQKQGYNYYKKDIEKSIQGLKKAYPKLSSQKNRKEAIAIAQQLSQQYKVQHLFFLSSFLDCQNRLLQLKTSTEGGHPERSEASAGEGIKNDLYYNLTYIA